MLRSSKHGRISQRMLGTIHIKIKSRVHLRSQYVQISGQLGNQVTKIRNAAARAITVPGRALHSPLAGVITGRPQLVRCAFSRYTKKPMDTARTPGQCRMMDSVLRLYISSCVIKRQMLFNSFRHYPIESVHVVVLLIQTPVTEHSAPKAMRFRFSLFVKLLVTLVAFHWN